MVIDGDEEFWIPYEISKIEFEVQWLIQRPLNRQLFNTEINSIKSWIIGQTFSAEQIYTQADFDEFARLSGDDNPIHVDPVFAARTGFGRTVAHGMLLYGTICGLLSRHFPGTVQLEQNFIFPAPTYTDETMTVQAEITAVNLETGQIRLKTTMANPDGQLTCDGETVLEWKEGWDTDKRG
ncbi:MAG: MaoC family dehydratase [Ardenticatenaceae bacterium]|nr:MaoC family dehydratase [Ardenticatenaceae bacterium]MCB9444400.1 MaoC family dehydratase [Ardenticatenaceae bacterium]